MNNGLVGFIGPGNGQLQVLTVQQVRRDILKLQSGQLHREHNMLTQYNVLITWCACTRGKVIGFVIRCCQCTVHNHQINGLQCELYNIVLSQVGLRVSKERRSDWTGI